MPAVMKGAFIFAGLTCLVVAVVAPGLSSGDAKATAEAPAPRSNPWSKNSTPVPKKVAVQQPWSAGETTLTRADDGHFYATVTSAGVETRMMVDTGATVIALTGRDAEAMGIRWSASDIRPVGQGASGPVYGFATTLDSVRVDGIEVSKVQAMIVPEGLGVSLLGQSFLRELDHVEVRYDTMVLSS
jgi:aspartyl protease family protein